MTKIFAFLAFFLAVSSAASAMRLEVEFDGNSIFGDPTNLSEDFSIFQLIFDDVSGGGVLATLTNTGNGNTNLGAWVIEGSTADASLWSSLSGTPEPFFVDDRGITGAIAGVGFPMPSSGLPAGNVAMWLAPSLSTDVLSGKVIEGSIGLPDRSSFSLELGKATPIIIASVPNPAALPMLISGFFFCSLIGRRKDVQQK